MTIDRVPPVNPVDFNPDPDRRGRDPSEAQRTLTPIQEGDLLRGWDEAQRTADAALGNSSSVGSTTPGKSPSNPGGHSPRSTYRGESSDTAKERIRRRSSFPFPENH